MRMFNNDQGFGWQEAAAILGLPILACGGTYLLIDQAFMKQNVTAQIMLFGGLTISSVIITLGYNILAKFADNHATARESDRLKDLVTIQSSLAGGLVRISEGSQRNALTLQKQLTENGKARQELLPIPSLNDIVFEADYEEMNNND